MARRRFTLHRWLTAPDVHCQLLQAARLCRQQPPPRHTCHCLLILEDTRFACELPQFAVPQVAKQRRQANPSTGGLLMRGPLPADPQLAAAAVITQVGAVATAPRHHFIMSPLAL